MDLLFVRCLKYKPEKTRAGLACLFVDDPKIYGVAIDALEDQIFGIWENLFLKTLIG